MNQEATSGQQREEMYLVSEKKIRCISECTSMKRSENKTVDERHFSLLQVDLELVLQKRFGIGIGDCLDQVELISSFINGESPVEIADDLERNRGLTDLNDL